MRFFNPWGFLYGGSILIIVLLYMLKPRHTEFIVSSTYLWDRTLKDTNVNRPWQKLKRNILMLMQLLIAMALVFAIARPYVPSMVVEGDVIVVIDLSGSMQANDVLPSRHEHAKEQILKLIDGMDKDRRMAIISMGARAQILARATGDRQILRRAIEGLEVENAGANIEEALSMASSLAADLKGAEILIYSDTQFDFEGGNYNSIVINENGDNVAIRDLSYSISQEGIIALSNIESFGYRGDIIIECYGDGILMDVKEIYIDDGDTQNIYWKGIPKGIGVLEVVIDIDDNLIADNRRFLAVDEKTQYDGLFISSGNIFLERAVGNYKGLELVKADTNEVENLSGYDIYILDSTNIETVPRDGHIILAGIKEDLPDLSIYLGDERKAADISLGSSMLSDEILNYVKLDDTYIGNFKSVDSPKWADIIVKSSEDPLLIAGEIDGRKIIAFLFDLQRSDLPLKKDFPILIYNILDWMLPNTNMGAENLYAGQEANIISLPSAKHIEVIAPSGDRHISDPLQELGIYKVFQETEKGEYIDYFGVNFPVHTESNLKLQDMEGKLNTDIKPNKIISRELFRYILWTILMLLMAEWWVYSYGY
ncbi:MAG: VWA domain-containing protein [Clostridiales bacterium]|nr:VWA domain-containing protein [Clostridiales bacterium]